MRLRFIGTGAAEGMPGVFCGCETCQTARERKGMDIRRRSAALLNDSLLLDFPPDLYSVTCEDARLLAVRHIFITHGHRTHFFTGDLPNMRSPYSRSKQPRICLYGSAEVGQYLKEQLGRYYDQIAPELLDLRVMKPFETAEADGLRVTALPARRCSGAFIYLIEDDESALLYAVDTGYPPEDVWDFLLGRALTTVVMDCCNLTEAETAIHMNIEDNVTLMRRLYAQKSANDKTRYIATHFSHIGGQNHAEISEALRLYGIRAAYDGMTVDG